MSENALGGRFTFPGTSSVAHLRENFAAATLALSPKVLAALDAVRA